MLTSPPFRILLLTPSPFIPLPLEKGKGGRIFRRGAMPLLNTPYEGRETNTGIEASPLFDSPREGVRGIG